MKPDVFPKRAFTLVELLLVIVIIAVLAAMVLPTLSGRGPALKAKARTEEADIINAINAFEADYGRFPISTNEQIAAGTNDFTTGMMAGFGTGPKYSYDNNSNVIAILMDLQYFPNGDPTVNLHHAMNPRQTKYLNARLSGYDPRTGGKPFSGVDNTGIYRDPWGNPYVITMDVNEDGQCNDLLYSLRAVSQNLPGSTNTVGYNGLSNTNITTAPDDFQYHGKVMVWSAGPDGQFYTSPANVGANKDNVVSWQ